MVFSGRGEHSTALEFHTEKPCWFKQTWLILGFVHLFSFISCFVLLAVIVLFTGFVYLNSASLSFHTWWRFYAKAQVSRNQQITQGKLSPLPLHLRTTTVNVGVLGSPYFRMEVEK